MCLRSLKLFRIQKKKYFHEYYTFLFFFLYSLPLSSVWCVAEINFCFIILTTTTTTTSFPPYNTIFYIPPPGWFVFQAGVPMEKNTQLLKQVIFLYFSHYRGHYNLAVVVVITSPIFFFLFLFFFFFFSF